MYSPIYFILITAIITIFIIIMVMGYIRKQQQTNIRRLIDEIANESPFRKNNNQLVRAHNDPLARNKLIEEKKRQELENGVSLYNLAEEVDKDKERVQIVGIVEPKGFWSRFIMSQKLSYIMARVNMQSANSGKGFWENLVKAQSSSQGKNQGRGR